MNPVLDAAASYIARGWPVFPVFGVQSMQFGLACQCGKLDCDRPAKHPAIRWREHASTDPNTVGFWFGDGRSNIGICTGARSGLIALDIDRKSDGEASLKAMEKRFSALPDTLSWRTGGGGRHYLFSSPSARIANSAGRLGQGIDIRGEGGFIIAPPSRHIEGGAYILDHEAPLAPMPAWLIEASRQEVQLSALVPSPDRRAAIGEEIREGGRNDALTRIAGALIRDVFAHRLSTEEALRRLHLANESRCHPPLPRGEVNQIFASIGGRHKRRMAHHG